MIVNVLLLKVALKNEAFLSINNTLHVLINKNYLSIKEATLKIVYKLILLIFHYPNINQLNIEFK